MDEDVSPKLKDSTVLAKTDRGRSVIRDRVGLVGPPQRAILVLVDGRSTVGQLKTFFAATKASEDTFQVLLELGLVEIVSSRSALRKPGVWPEGLQETVGLLDGPNEALAAARFNEVYETMVTVTANFLGLRGYFMQLKLERCQNLIDLEALRGDLIRAIEARHGRILAKSVENILDV